MDNLTTPDSESPQQEITKIYHRIDQAIGRLAVPTVSKQSSLSRKLLEVFSKSSNNTDIIDYVLRNRVNIYNKGDPRLAEMAESAINLILISPINKKASTQVVNGIKYYLSGVPSTEHRFKIVAYTFGFMFVTLSLFAAPIILAPLKVTVEKNIVLTGYCGIVGTLIGFGRKLEDVSQLALAGPNDFA